MKNTLVILLVIFSLIVTPYSYAQLPVSSGDAIIPLELIEDEASEMLYPTLPVFGQDHNYSITLRQNGEGMVNMRVSFSNFDPAELDTLVLSTTTLNPSEVAAFQIIKERVCTQFDTTTKGFSSSMSEVQRCLSYDEPNYFEMWGMNNKYLRAQADYSDGKITIKLPEPVEEGKSGSYVLFMRVEGISEKVFGGSYEYSFETFTTDTPIRNVSIGISSDSDMKFKGAEGMVSYEDTVMRATFASAVSSKQPSFQSPDLDNYVYQIGYGQVTKSSQNLSPGDTYNVSGLYGKTLVNLYLKEAVLISVSVLAFLGILIGGIVLFGKRKKSPNASTPASGTTRLLILVTISFLSSMIIVGVTLGLFALSRMLETWSIYGQGMFLFLIVSIVSFGVYSFLFIAPSVFAWMKYGKKWAAITLGLSFFWIILLLLIIGGYILLSGTMSQGMDTIYKTEPIRELNYGVSEGGI